jgi:hypothetical protein
MLNTKLRSVLFIASLAALAAFGTGCYAEVEAQPVAYGGYVPPESYDGYVVYYSDDGRPYYYVNGGVYWVPTTSPYYGYYANHWRTYGGYYRGWYGRYSAPRYRTYRYAPSYRRYR